MTCSAPPTYPGRRTPSSEKSHCSTDPARVRDHKRAEIDAIEDPELDATGVLPPDFVTVLRFVNEVVASPTVPDTIFDAARDVLDDRDLITIVVLIGLYMSIARILGVLQVPLDEQPDTWTSEH